VWHTIQQFCAGYVLALAQLLGYLWAAAKADPLRAGLVAVVVITFCWAWRANSPKHTKGHPAHYLKWLEVRSDAFETCVRFYAHTQDDGTEARRVLDLMNGEKP